MEKEGGRAEEMREKRERGRKEWGEMGGGREGERAEEMRERRREGEKNGGRWVREGRREALKWRGRREEWRRNNETEVKEKKVENKIREKIQNKTKNKKTQTKAGMKKVSIFTRQHAGRS